jgi:hypothetical protein
MYQVTNQLTILLSLGEERPAAGIRYHRVCLIASTWLAASCAYISSE